MLYDLKEANNKTVETYTRVVSEPGSSNKKDYGIRKRKFKNKKHTERRKKTRKDIRAMKTESNRKYIKDLSNLELTNDQINLLSRGLKFVPMPITNETALRKQLLIQTSKILLGECGSSLYITARIKHPPLLREVKLGTTSSAVCHPRKLSRGN